MNQRQPIPFDNTYARLPERFYSQQQPEPVPAPAGIAVNESLSRQLGIDPLWLQAEDGVAMVAGNLMPPGAEPISAAYAGHQFGSWNPQLGDGRAILLGEVVADNGQRYDIQLKGSGPTHWSRGGDGRAPLGPVLREYIVSEAMYALGVPTSRSLAAATTGAPVYRDSALPGAVLARVASSHIRIGTFQYFAARQDREALELLVQHSLQRHYPHATQQQSNPALALLEAVVEKQAQLIAHWQLLGFIHGVMNTDNVLISGETIDYGPCAFMDDFNPDTVFSSIDHGGRYAYRNQPSIGHWNLSCLAQCLLPLIDDDEEAAIAGAQAAIDRYPDLFLHSHNGGMAKKLGLAELREEDEQLMQDLLTVMAETRADFTLCFRRLADLVNTDAGPGISAIYELPGDFDQWLGSWRARLSDQTIGATDLQRNMYQVNPVFIPRNHLVEAAIASAVGEESLDKFQELLAVTCQPFEYNEEFSEYALPPRPEQQVHQTFCGT